MWNVNGYEEFSTERIQPSIDLATRVMQIKPEINSILDIGCGSGLSTSVLKKLWHNAEITGMDLSIDMLEKARNTLPGINFILKDCSTATDLIGSYDLIFSNAFLQWASNQKLFIQNIKSNLSDNGILAMQIPNYENMPVAKCVQKATASFRKLLSREPETSCFTYDPSDYYNMFASCYSYIEMRETNYFHQMKNQMDILSFISTTALAPYLDVLEKKYHKQFKECVLYYIKQAYPSQENGIVLFPFKRIFVTAWK